MDLGSQQRNHPVENPQLKADKASCRLQESSAVINSTLLNDATAWVGTWSKQTGTVNAPWKSK